MKKILIISSAFAPYHGSELGVGFNFTLEMSKSNYIDLVTMDYWMPYIEQYKKENPDAFKNISFIYVGIYPFQHIGPNKYQPLNHYYWLIKCMLRLKNINTEVYDLIHYLTLSTVYYFPLPAFLKKKKFIWGPVGGDAIITMKHLRYTSSVYILNNIIRAIITNILRYIYKILYNTGILKIDYIICRTKYISEFFSYYNNREILPETGFNVVCNHENDQSIDYRYLNIVIIGRLITRKNIALSLAVFKELLNLYPNSKLTIYGDGPLSTKLKSIVNKYNINNNVTFKGNVKREVLLAELSDFNLCLHLGLREGMSWGIIESLSKGIPVCCYDIGANSEIINYKNGILLNVKNNVPIVIAEEISKFIRKDPNRLEISRTLNNHSWAKRVQKMAEIYEQMLKS